MGCNFETKQHNYCKIWNPCWKCQWHAYFLPKFD